MERTFKNIVGKGENAGNQHFFLLPQFFLPFERKKSKFVQHFVCRVQKLSIWADIMCLSFGEEKIRQSIITVIMVIREDVDVQRWR